MLVRFSSTVALATRYPLTLAPARATVWRDDEAGHSMRSLVYFVATFVVALILGI